MLEARSRRTLEFPRYTPTTRVDGTDQGGGGVQTKEGDSPETEACRRKSDGCSVGFMIHLDLPRRAVRLVSSVLNTLCWLRDAARKGGR